MKDHDHKCSQRHVRGDDESGKPEVTNAIKKAEPLDPAFLQLKLLCICWLLLKLSPHTCQSNQTKAKKKHGGGFRNGGHIKIICPNVKIRTHIC